jgi:hypothetical protein
LSNSNYTSINQGRRAALDRAGNKRFDGAGMNTHHNSFHDTDTTRFRSKDAIEARERQAYVDGFNDAVDWALAIIDLSVFTNGVAKRYPTATSSVANAGSKARRVGRPHKKMGAAQLRQAADALFKGGDDE